MGLRAKKDARFFVRVMRKRARKVKYKSLDKFIYPEGRPQWENVWV